MKGDGGQAYPSAWSTFIPSRLSGQSEPRQVFHHTEGLSKKENFAIRFAAALTAPAGLDPYLTSAQEKAVCRLAVRMADNLLEALGYEDEE